MQNSTLIALHKTEDSMLCNEVFSNNKAISISHNDWTYALKFLKQGYNDEVTLKATYMLNNFINFLSSRKLECEQFYFGYNSKIDQYIFSYEISSKKHKNSNFKVDGSFKNDGVLFNFFPQMFPSFLIDVLSEVPHRALIEVSRGK